jgi:hypothetical protein
MFVKEVFFLSLTLAVGVAGTRTALHIRFTKGSRAEGGVMLALGWSPLVIWLLSQLLSLAGGPG